MYRVIPSLVFQLIFLLDFLTQYFLYIFICRYFKVHMQRFKISLSYFPKKIILERGTNELLQSNLDLRGNFKFPPFWTHKPLSILFSRGHQLYFKGSFQKLARLPRFEMKINFVPWNNLFSHIGEILSRSAQYEPTVGIRTAVRHLGNPALFYCNGEI